MTSVFTSQQCFSDASTRRPADLLSSFTTIKTLMNNLYDGLGKVLLALLKNSDTRESVLQYLAEVINRNLSRAHIQVLSWIIQSRCIWLDIYNAWTQYDSMCLKLWTDKIIFSLWKLLIMGMQLFHRLILCLVQVQACLSISVLSCFGFASRF